MAEKGKVFPCGGTVVHGEMVELGEGARVAIGALNGRCRHAPLRVFHEEIVLLA